MLRAGQREQARELATTLLASLNGEGMIGSRNATLALRMQTAPTFHAFLEDAPRTVLADGFLSQAAENIPCSKSSPGCIRQIPPKQFDGDAASVFNTQLPLSLWIDATAPSSPLPQHLRESVASAAWVRAVSLNDIAAVKQLAPALTPAIRSTAGDSTGFPATRAMLRNPGLRPYLDQGVQRSASLHQLDDYRDNWWCGNWGPGHMPYMDESTFVIQSPTVPLAFLTPEDQTRTRTEHTFLDNLAPGVTWIGRRAIDYVTSHPADPNAAEALALTVSATHYGCSVRENQADAQRAVSKEAFQLLHRRYPKSVWAEKTPYYY